MITLNDRFDIDEGRPLPVHDQPLARAYAAVGKGTAAAGLPVYALVAHTLLPVRSDMANSQRAITHPSVPRPHAFGVVDWPTGERLGAFIYDIPAGDRLAASENTPFTPMREDVLIEKMVRPLAHGMSDLARTGIFHGAIRVSNIYMTDRGAAFGDNLAAPAGYGQPAVYETIDRGLAPDIARGPGYTGDDLYAFGATLAAALIGHRPLQEVSDDAMLQLKMERGSYTALAGERRFSTPVIELLRGLLADDPKQRWDIQDLELWVQGRRLTPRQSIAGRKAVRPVEFAGQEFTQVRQLAAALPHDTKLAATFIRNHELARWIANGFNDEKLLEYVTEAEDIARMQKAGGDEERLVTSTITALDPLGPIRYRGISVFPGGLPLVLADMMIREQPPGIVVEILNNDFPNFWLGYQPEKRPELLAAVQACDKARERIIGPGLGFGVERVLYDLNPTLTCLSPGLRGRGVTTVHQLLEVLDQRAASGLGAALMDRHIAAFILARDRILSPQVVKACESNDPTTRSLGLLTLYSELQYRHGPEMLKNLGSALAAMAEATVRRFKSRLRRDRITAELKNIAATGKLANMLKLVDDPVVLAQDSEEFIAARYLYHTTEDEVERLTATTRGRKTLAREAGEPLAAALSVGAAFILLVVQILQIFSEF